MATQTNMFETAAVDYASAIGCACNHRGLEGTIVAYDTESYVEPMFIIEFVNGRRGVLSPTELGAAS